MKKSKKFVALFLVFSLVFLYANLFAKEKRGALLVITKMGGEQISGELITVKKNSVHNNTSSAKFNSYQEYYELTKSQNEHAKRNVTVDKNDKTALIGGIGLVTSYVVTVVIGNAITSSFDIKITPYYLIPVVGPFLQIPESSSPYTELCILSGVVQTGFFVVLVYGLIKNKKPPNESSFQIVWAPIVSKNTSGIMLELRF